MPYEHKPLRHLRSTFILRMPQDMTHTSIRPLSSLTCCPPEPSRTAFELWRVAQQDSLGALESLRILESQVLPAQGGQGWVPPALEPDTRSKLFQTAWNQDFMISPYPPLPTLLLVTSWCKQGCCTSSAHPERSRCWPRASLYVQTTFLQQVMANLASRSKCNDLGFQHHCYIPEG